MVIYSKHKEHKKSIHHTLKINLPQPRPKHIVLCSRFTGRPSAVHAHRRWRSNLSITAAAKGAAPYPLVSRFTHSRTDVLLSLATSVETCGVRLPSLQDGNTWRKAGVGRRNCYAAFRFQFEDSERAASRERDKRSCLTSASLIDIDNL